MIKLSTIKPNPSNPRIIKDDKFKKLCQSLKDLPRMMELRPIVVDDNNIVQGGNMRLKALTELGYKELPETWVKKATDFTAEELREFIIKDNVGFGEWDWEDLANNWDAQQLTDWGLEIPDFVDENDLREEYSAKIGEVIYEPKSTNHQPSDLFARENKFDTFIDKIENEGIKEMLKARAAYFSTFNYSKIADYYAYQANQDEKDIFEKLALVLLDKDKLIENGFSEMVDTIQEENGYND